MEKNDWISKNSKTKKLFVSLRTHETCLIWFELCLGVIHMYMQWPTTWNLFFFLEIEGDPAKATNISTDFIKIFYLRW